MIETPKLTLTQICLDTLILTIVGLPILVIRKTGKIYEQGFFCNDENIMQPIPEDTIISSKYFYLIGNLTITCTVILVEFSLRKNKKIQLIKHLKISLWCYNIYQIFLSFSLGLLATILITTIFKGSIGRLRPYFFSSCVPNINCSLPQNQEIYHTDFICTNKNFKKNSRLSFPSGHSSYAMFCGLFLGIYLHKRTSSCKNFKLITSAIQIALFVVVFYIGCTRISEYHHHWSDVLAGYVIGLVCALFTSINLYNHLETGFEPILTK